MKIHIRLFGRELLAVDIDPQGEAPDPQPDEPEPEAEPEQLPETEPEIPAGFGFHGGSGGSHQMGWQPVTDRPPLIDRHNPRP